ncbi:MAG TPA: DUF2339 domain-containing protein [Candidatus Acidoferrum sp.]|nr:DUF2339 domain-containing protein [Candidatus Acidoferrum sp.]
MADPLNELEFLRTQVAALTARVYQLELARQAPSQVVSTPAPPPSTPSATPPTTASPTDEHKFQPSIASVGFPTLRRTPNPLSIPRGREGDLEKKIGQYWLNRVGIAAMLIGVSYFLKYAFENNWIGPGGRICIGLLCGIALILWSERFRTKGHDTFSYSLKAVGIGTLYLSLWGAFQVYHLIPASAAFIAMILVSASTIALALSQDAELLASFAMVGGFATPVLLSTGQNHEAVLFCYTALLDVAILLMAVVKPWRRLLWGSFAGTIILCVGWYSSYYTLEQRPLTVFFAALFAAIFAAVPLVTRYERSTRFSGPSITLTLLPLINAVTFFLQLYIMYETETTTLTWFALALAAFYLGISAMFKKRFPEDDVSVINLLHVAIAIAFITIAIPLKLEAQWITIGWLIESATLLWVSVRTKTNFLRYLAVAALALGIFRLLAYDQLRAQTLIFNARFATYAVAIAVLGGIATLGKEHAAESERPFLRLAVITLNLLALIALTREAADYFDRQFVAVGNQWQHYHQISVVRGFAYSAIWLIYGVALMAVGFRNRSAFLRWQALILIAFTTGKIFLYDVSQLGGSYRILSFIALGAVLLGISFIYQRDWLKLSSDSPDQSAPAHPAREMS